MWHKEPQSNQHYWMWNPTMKERYGSDHPILVYTLEKTGYVQSIYGLLAVTEQDVFRIAMLSVDELNELPRTGDAA